jgi:hypothetical protein
MENKGAHNIPAKLFECITFLVQVLPVRSVPTFIELLIGAMITRSGFVTDAWLAINPKRTWSAYYKWLQQGKWSWVALGVQMARLVVNLFPQPIWFLIFDDTFIYRCSKKAPGAGIFHQHGNKTNRPQYALGQCWMSLSLSISRNMKHSAIPLLARLMRTTGNRTKLDTAKVLLRVIAPVFAGKKVITLVDSWFMKWPYLSYVLQLGFQAIGQVRKDTALFGIPAYVQNRKQGRPRKYGDRFDAEVVNALHEKRERIFIYSEWRWVRYRSELCLCRFMQWRKIRAVWMQIEEEDGSLSKQRLILCTDSSLMPQQIFAYYGRRWSIEDLFNQLKNQWGWKDAWQQSRLVLHRWTQILAIAYALPRLLATYCEDQVAHLMHLTPWRKQDDTTAGRVRLGLQNLLGHVRVRGWWNPKSRIFEVPIDKGLPQKCQSCGKCQKNSRSKNNLARSSSPPS